MTSPQPEPYERLVELLKELFEFDKADLDFGIYRIMNERREEVSRFLEQELLPEVRTALAEYGGAERGAIEAQMNQLQLQLREAGVPYEASPKYRELQAQLAESDHQAALEVEVYSDLYRFFKRYYKDGDFLSLRRYKEGVYAIPYEGEEVKLYWANHDQYYVKSSESFQNYRFRLPDGRHVHFRIVVASTERDNNKPAEGRERRFVLRAEAPAEEVEGELNVNFEYRESADKQGDLNIQATSKLLDLPALRAWREALATPSPTQSNPGRTLLEKHLTDYTARNSFDYFIHKDLGSFLRRELDFFLKNEVLHVDDLDVEDEAHVGKHLAKLRAIKRIGRKIIEFLGQLENFQKKLWLKKKFVVETNYCITLDRIPEDFYPEIAANDAQREEWVRLFAIDEIKGDLLSPGYCVPLPPEFLRANDKLLLDTRFLGAEFRLRLLASIEDLDAQTDGVLIHSDNFQALRLLERRYQRQVKCIYIDPPYNTNSSSIPYKNDYRHSSWVTMMRDRLALLRPMLPMDGAIFVSIDKTERTVLEHAMDDVFDRDNRIEELVWAMNTNNSQAPNYSTNHEYVEVYSRHRPTAEQDRNMFREPKPGFEDVMALVTHLNPAYLPVAEIESELRKLYMRHQVEYREEIEALGLNWEDEKGNDPWKGLFNYNRAEYRDAVGSLITEAEAGACEGRIWIWREDNSSMPAAKQSPTTRDPGHRNWRFYKPPHPITGRPCPHPKSGGSGRMTMMRHRQTDVASFPWIAMAGSCGDRTKLRCPS